MAKQNPKYVKKIPKPGGGFYYIYPDQIKKQWDSFKQNAKNKTNAAKQNIKEKSGLNARENYKNLQGISNRAMAGSAKSFDKSAHGLTRTINKATSDAKKAYESTPLARAEKATKKAGSAAKTAGKAAGAAASAAIGLDKRKDYKDSQKGANVIKKTIDKHQYNDTIAGKVERALAPATKKIGATAAAVKAYKGAKSKGISTAVYEDLDGKKTYKTAGFSKDGKFRGATSATKIGSAANKARVKGDVAVSNYKTDVKNRAKALGQTLLNVTGTTDEYEYVKKKAKKNTSKAKKKISKALNKLNK